MDLSIGIIKPDLASLSTPTPGSGRMHLNLYQVTLWYPGINTETEKEISHWTLPTKLKPKITICRADIEDPRVEQNWHEWSLAFSASGTEY